MDGRELPAPPTGAAHPHALRRPLPEPPRSLHPVHRDGCSALRRRRSGARNWWKGPQARPGGPARSRRTASVTSSVAPGTRGATPAVRTTSGRSPSVPVSPACSKVASRASRSPEKPHGTVRQRWAPTAISPGGSEKTIDSGRNRDLHQASSRESRVDRRKRLEHFVRIAGILLGMGGIDEHEAGHFARKALGVHANQRAAQ